jgi:hypothetical protein
LDLFVHRPHSLRSPARFPNSLASERGHELHRRAVRFNHIGIPTTERFDGEIDVPHLHMTVSDHQDNPFGIQWMRYWDDSPLPDLVKTVPHAAFEVDDLEEAMGDFTVLTEPNRPSPGVRVAMIEVRGAPIELMQIDHERRPDL